MTSEIKSFEDMNISTNILRGIFSHGWEFPSPIQQKIIVPIIKGKDTIKGKENTKARGNIKRKRNIPRERNRERAYKRER